MSRLIDVDCLNFEGQHYNKSQMKAILDFLDAQPTAYDTDKVVEQIYKEQEREFINNEVAIGDITCSEVVEIVKGGGVNVKHK